MANQKNQRNQQQGSEKRAPQQDSQNKRQGGRQHDEQKMPQGSSRRDDFENDATTRNKR